MIFKSLLARFSGKSKPFMPSLTPEQREALRSLTFTSGWTVYLEMVDAYIDHNARAMLNTSNDADVHCFRGLVQGLELGPILVDSIIKKEDKEDARERSQSRIDAERAAADVTLYGTGLWDRTG